MVESLGVPNSIQHTSAPPRLLELACGNTILGGRVGWSAGLGCFCVAWVVGTVYGVAQSRDLDGVGSRGTWTVFAVAGLRRSMLDPCQARDVP